jgi:putative membrane protein
MDSRIRGNDGLCIFGGNMELNSEFTGIIKFLAYFAAAIFMTILFLIIYIRITPYKEFELIDSGNTAAAYSITGALFGFIIPLASAIIHSVNFFDMVIWGFVALVVQVIIYLVVKLLYKGLADAIKEGVVSKGFFLGAVSLAAGILNAACMSY